MADLETMFGAPAPPAVAALPPADRDALSALMVQALERQHEELRIAFEQSLKAVPFPLRAVVKKVLL